VRVIAGSLGGRTLTAPRGLGTRPTSDRVREALFAALGDVESLAVLDLYAGSGALAIEALSRGAGRALCVERDRAALRALHDNLAALDLGDVCRVLPVEVARARGAIAKAGPFDLVLCDPPYADVRSGRVARDLARALATEGVLGPGARLVLEHGKNDQPPPLPGLVVARSRRYGDTTLTFYDRAGPDGATAGPGA
jgi:16S rRNA (guanine966-N2)-methyltransferase